MVYVYDQAEAVPRLLFNKTDIIISLRNVLAVIMWAYGKIHRGEYIGLSFVPFRCDLIMHVYDQAEALPHLLFNKTEITMITETRFRD